MSSTIFATFILVLLAVNTVVGLVWFIYAHLHRSKLPQTSGGQQTHPAATATIHQVAAPVAAPKAPPQGPVDTGRLEAKAEAAFEQAINDATASFKADVGGSSHRLGDLIVRLTTDVVEKEMEVYRTALGQARDASIQSLQQMQTTIESRQQELVEGVEGELQKRKQALIDRLDAKLGAAVAAYVVESLGQGVDLGAQRSYLLQSLEAHKDELKKDLLDEL